MGINMVMALGYKVLFTAVGIAGIGFLIAFHELGHFLFCKLFGIRTPSFSVGFGPRLFSKKIGDTLFSISIIPLGGYVEIEGMAEVAQGEQELAHSTSEGSFASKPYYQKMLVIGGGILFNLIFAYGALTLLFAMGIPQTPLLFPKNAVPVIRVLIEDGPAARGGLQEGDKLLMIDETPILKVEDLLAKVQGIPGKTAMVVFDRAGTTETKPVSIGSKIMHGQEMGFLGVEFQLIDLPAQGFQDAISEGITTTNKLVGNTFVMFTRLFQTKSTNGLGGPLMMISQTIKGAEKGFKIFIVLLAFISVNLAVLNVLPVPILDGGQAVFYTIEALVGHELPAKARLYIHYACWLLVVILMLLLTVKDIRYFIGL